MKNVTVSLDEKVALWTRIRAAEQNMSVSKMLSQFLEAKMREEQEYSKAKDLFFSRLPVKMKDEKTEYPSRDSIHER